MGAYGDMYIITKESKSNPANLRAEFFWATRGTPIDWSGGNIVSCACYYSEYLDPEFRRLKLNYRAQALGAREVVYSGKGAGGIHM